MNTKLKCLLLDDEIPGLSYLKMLCEQIPQLEVVKAFDSASRLLEEIPNLEADLCILDIEMPEISGLQVANLLNGKPVIFATAYKDYALDAFDLNAIDYLVKPIRLERLKQAIRKAEQYLKGQPLGTERSFVHLNTNRGKAILFFDKIAYIKTSPYDSRDKLLRFFDGDELILKNINFESLLQLLPASDFCRINKKEILALKAVQVFSFSEITTTLASASGDFIQLSLGENYRSEFLKKVSL